MKDVLGRLKSLIIKLISMKGLAFMLATWFLWVGKIDATTWWLSVTALTAVRAAEKKIAADHA